MRNLIFAALFFFTLNSGAQAAEFTLSPNDSIQEAINNASNGDIINLSAGKFKESFELSGKAITIRGQGASTLLQGNRFKAAITINQDEGRDTIIENITFTKGLRAGAITIDKAAATIRKSYFYKNRSRGDGSAILIFETNSNGDSALITNNVFFRNKTRSFKPGNVAHTIRVIDASPEIINNSFIANDRAAVYITGLSRSIIMNNVFSYMGMIKAPERRNPQNFSLKEQRGRALFLENLKGGSNIQVSYNISYGHKTADAYIQEEDFSFSSLEENSVAFLTVSNNINAEPGFGNASFNKKATSILKLETANLSSDSIARNAGNPDPAYNDFDASQNDIGATGGATPFSFSSLPRTRKNGSIR